MCFMVTVPYSGVTKFNQSLICVIVADTIPPRFMVSLSAKQRVSFAFYLASMYEESDFTFTFHFHTLEKDMATHSSVLAWRIPGMGSWWTAIYGVTQSQTQLT